MALVATPTNRRIAMAVLLVLAAAGGVIRALAPDPSTARDIGTLMLVLWLPAVGNLMGYLVEKVPRSAPPPLAYSPDAPFSLHPRGAAAPLGSQVPPAGRHSASLACWRSAGGYEKNGPLNRSGAQ